MCRVISVCLVILLAVAVNAHAARAGRLWCKADPVISLDQRLVSITVAIPVEYLLLVNGPTTIGVKTPKTVDRQIVLNDLGFMGHGTIITFTDGGGIVANQEIPVEITVRVPIDLSLLAPGETVPVEVTVLADDLLLASAIGTSELTKMRLTIVGR
jgi:hypothetical protein